MNIREELDNEIRIRRQLQLSPQIKTCRRSNNPYEKYYSPEKPKNCYVNVRFCYDCTEPKCTYKRDF